MLRLPRAVRSFASKRSFSALPLRSKTFSRGFSRTSLAFGLGASTALYSLYKGSVGSEVHAEGSPAPPQMTFRKLGNTGLWVSSLGFGCWITVGQVDEESVYQCVKAAYDSGINFFDHAEAYAEGEAELVMGRVFKRLGAKRSDLVLTTKIYWGGKGVNDVGLSRKHIIEGVDASLKRLQTDYVDIVFCHRPDVHTPIEETVRAMNHVINTGKAFYWGTSEWSAEEIQLALAVAEKLGLQGPTAEQPQYNLLTRDRFEREYANLFSQGKLGSTIWSPLASGILTGKYSKGIPAGSRLAYDKYSWLREAFTSGRRLGDWNEVLSTVQRLEPLAHKLDCTLAQLSIAWTLKNPNVSTVITGATKPEQIWENIKALDVVGKLTPDILKEIDDIMGNKPILREDWTRRNKLTGKP